MARSCFLSFALLFFLFFAACDASTEDGSSGDVVVSILQQTFVPSAIEAHAGDVVFFYNQDAIIHRILSESAADFFDNTGVFDSGELPVGETGMITIPDTAGVGTIYYFYDDYLENQMTTPNGTITITP